MDQLVNIENVSKEVNYKSKLIEWGQKHKINIDFLGEEGKEDGGASPIFWSSIIIAGAECGRGKGYSKKESQQNAAREALERIHKDRNFVLSITAPKELQMERYDDIPSVTAEEKQAAQHMDDDSVDIDFSDITMKAKSREDIIAKAEAQAFAE